uniref:HSF-type DNA-binding domain-containing protein n=1 Tax=Hyaloperonospora arabidopsidis (strain Emoy2) TaxID=559515 RepID=M4BRZ7_HYAAE
MDASDSRTLKRARLLSHRGCTMSPKAAVDDDTGLPAALAASAIACKVPKFLRSLYAILQTEDPHIISWVQNKDLTPNRVTAFHILEMERFEREILPKYFKHQKFASFQRQLNNFGFRKWTKTQSSGVCTFSHNCFPPDLSAATPCNMSIRDQWRQKSTQVQTSVVAGGTMDSPLMKRGFVSNGIATAKAQHLHVDHSSVSRRRPVHVQVPGRDIVDTTSPFGEMYRSPNSTASVDSSAFRHHLSHQPPLKKLARPHVVVKQETSDLLDGLEAFCDDSFKQVVLPPLQPHYLQAATPRSTLLSASLTSPFSIPSDFGTAQAPSGCRFPLPQVVNDRSSSSILSADARCGSTGFKSFDMKQLNETPLSSIRNSTTNGAADAAALQGAFLEPWMWDAQTGSSSFELASVPLEFECRRPDLDCKPEPEWQEISSASTYQVVNELSADVGTTDMLNIELCHQQDRGEPSNSGDCGLETLLFAE